MIYRVIGKAIVKYMLFLGRRYVGGFRVAVALLVAAIGIAAYLARRNVPEG